MRDFPTVLVARDDDGLDGPLVHLLQRNGFHVLEADWAHVFDVVRVHSRQIHLLLADASLEACVQVLKNHRSELLNPFPSFVPALPHAVPMSLFLN